MFYLIVFKSLMSEMWYKRLVCFCFFWDILILRRVILGMAYFNNIELNILLYQVVSNATK